MHEDKNYEKLLSDINNFSVNESHAKNYPQEFVEDKDLFSHLVKTARLALEYFNMSNKENYKVEGIQGIPIRKFIYISALFHDVGKPKDSYGSVAQYDNIIKVAGNMLRELGFSSAIIDNTLFVIKNGEFFNLINIENKSNRCPISEFKKWADKYYNITKNQLKHEEDTNQLLFCLYIVGMADASANGYKISQSNYSYHFNHVEVLCKIRQYNKNRIFNSLSSMVRTESEPIQWTKFDPDNPRTVEHSSVIMALVNRGIYRKNNVMPILKEAAEKTGKLLDRNKYLAAGPYKQKEAESVAYRKELYGQVVIILLNRNELEEDNYKKMTEEKTGVVKILFSYETVRLLKLYNPDLVHILVVDKHNPVYNRDNENVYNLFLHKTATEFLNSHGLENNDIIVHVTTTALFEHESKEKVLNLAESLVRS